MVDRLASMLVLACVLCSSLCAAADEGAKLPLGQDPRWSPDSRLVAASHRGFETLGLVVWEPATERVRSFALPSIPVRPRRATGRMRAASVRRGRGSIPTMGKC